jgi:hypothetical protein
MKKCECGIRLSLEHKQTTTVQIAAKIWAPASEELRGTKLGCAATQ